VAYGGLGPLFGAYLLRELNLEEVLILPACGVLSALGLLVADRACESSAGVNLEASLESDVHLQRILEHLDAAVSTELARQTTEPRTITHVLDMHYKGQSHDLRVPLPIGDSSTAAAALAFRQAYRQLFGYADDVAPIEIVGIHSVASVTSPSFPVRPEEASRSVGSSRVAVVEASRGFEEVKVLGRADVPTGGTLIGPLIVEQADTTIVVLPGQVLREDHGAFSISAISAMADMRSSEPAHVS